MKQLLNTALYNLQHDPVVWIILFNCAVGFVVALWMMRWYRRNITERGGVISVAFQRTGMSQTEALALKQELASSFSSFFLHNAGKLQVLMMIVVACVAPISIPIFIWMCIRQYRQWQLLQEELKHEGRKHCHRDHEGRLLVNR